MTDCVLLRGYHYSVYTRIVRVALSEKRVAHDIEEIDPFTPGIPKNYPCPASLRASSLSCPMERFDIYETAAIVRYVDAAFPGASLVPAVAPALARATQVVFDHRQLWISTHDTPGLRPPRVSAGGGRKAGRKAKLKLD